MAKSSLKNYQYFEYLAGRIRQGDNDAFTELYQQTYDTMYRYAYYLLQDQDLVHDALQEIYISIFKNIRSLKIDRLLPSWMRQIAFHICCDMANERRQQRERSISMGADDFDAYSRASHSEADAFKSVYDKETSHQLHDALRCCSQRERQAFVLRYNYDLKLEEIADFMDVSVASVKRYITSARDILRRQIGDEALNPPQTVR